MANRSDIIYQTLEFFAIGATDIVNIFVGCILMFLGAMLVVGFWTRFIALALLILLAISGYCWLPQASQVNFHVEALYGILFFYLFLIGGGQWAISRKSVQSGQSVLESEQSILLGEARPSIFNGDGDVILTPPVDSEEEISNDESTENSEEEDEGS